MEAVRTRLDLRVDKNRRGVWEKAAAVAGLDLSAWVRRCCDEAAALEGALERERESREYVPSPDPEAYVEQRVDPSFFPVGSPARSFRGPDPKPGKRR